MRQSNLFGGTRRETPQGEESKNAVLLLRGGYIDKLLAGVYTYLPLGFRIIEKIKAIVRLELNQLPHTNELLLPILQPRELWEETGRWEEAKLDVMYTLEKDTLALGPTHEEILTDIFRRYVNSYKEVPLALYQIQTKFRRELRAKSGLLRGREFLMKDMYSFHISEEDLDRYYQLAIPAYFKIFERCGLKPVLTKASGGMFSKYSDEFQLVNEAGEDTIYLNETGDEAWNDELAAEVEDKSRPARAIEVGNIFKLNKRFSTPMKAQVTLEDGQLADVWMGCYGIGISRLLGVVVEQYGDIAGKIAWPKEIAPFEVHLIDLTPDQQGSKLYEKLKSAEVEVLYDDRDKSAGEKFADADLVGAPVRLVISKRSLADGGVERQDWPSGERTVVSEAEVLASLA